MTWIISSKKSLELQPKFKVGDKVHFKNLPEGIGVIISLNKNFNSVNIKFDNIFYHNAPENDLKLAK